MAARKRGTPDSPEDAVLTGPLLGADLAFMGPGSPTYAVRQLQNSLAWHRLIARHRVGATLAFASAAVVAVSAFALPVYEIYKAGHDLSWQPGLDLFGAYGLKLVFVPHWNNSDGGVDLDTSRCYMGRARFEALLAMLPHDATIVGIDEHTALAADLDSGTAEVMGAGDVTVFRFGDERQFSPGGRFPISEFGPFHLPQPDAGLPPQVWAEAQAVAQQRSAPAAAFDEVTALVAERKLVRERGDWPASDALRERITALGWQVSDTPDGPVIARLGSKYGTAAD